MSALYKLQVPNGAPDVMLRPYIAVPTTPDGAKFASWWKTASAVDRIKVVLAGDEDGNYVAAFKKRAADVVEVDDKGKQEADRLSAIETGRMAHDKLVEDSSGMTQPPTNNP